MRGQMLQTDVGEYVGSEKTKHGAQKTPSCAFCCSHFKVFDPQEFQGVHAVQHVPMHVCVKVLYVQPNHRIRNMCLRLCSLNGLKS